jgi:type VI secretion system protein ImpK
MRLTHFWIPSMEAARSALAEPGQSAAALAGQIRILLDQAGARALEQGFAPAEIEAALFAVVAWIDELAMSRSWAGTASWRLAPLQRHYFSTTRAGSEFFERLDALPEESVEVREVYALVLLAGFNGRYTHRPAAELADYRLATLAQVAQERTMAPLAADQPLFPDAGLLADAPAHSKSSARPSWAMFLLIVIPLACLGVLYFFLDYRVDQLATQILAPLAAVL